MAFTQSQLDALEEAIAQGARQVSWTAAGTTKTVTYGSLSEMLRVRDLIRRRLGQANSASSRLYFTTSKGTDCPSQSGYTEGDDDDNDIG